MKNKCKNPLGAELLIINPGKNPQCLLQVNQGKWCQETYETASRDAAKRAKQLRELGYHVTVSSLGSQVTPLGSMKLTMVDVRPGTNSDTGDLPSCEHVQWPNKNGKRRKSMKLRIRRMNKRRKSHKVSRVRYRNHLYTYAALVRKFGKRVAKRVWSAKKHRKATAGATRKAISHKSAWMTLVKRHGVMGAKRRYRKHGRKSRR